MEALPLVQLWLFIRLYLYVEFGDVVFDHCHREANMAEHTLANKVEEILPFSRLSNRVFKVNIKCHVDPSCVWKEDPLDFLVYLITKDVSLFLKLI
jgi:hypothetical protein